VLAQLSVFNVGAQDNIIPNGDFEKKLACPSGDHLAPISLADGWKSCVGSPNYYHECNAAIAPSSNLFGYQEAYSDSASVGIGVYIDYLPNFHEAVRISLSESLVSGIEYYFEMYASLADSVNFSVGELQAYFSVEKPELEPGDSWLNVDAQIVNDPITNPLTSKEGWTRVSGTFLAEGGEQWVAIGVFDHDNELTIDQVSNHPQTNENWDLAYYYIDDALLLPLEVWLDMGERESEQISASVYPNPNNGEFRLNIATETSAVYRVEIQDMKGKLLYRLTVYDGTSNLDVSRLEAGVYILSIHDVSDGRVYNGRIVLQE
jgi:hypothetical protein